MRKSKWMIVPDKYGRPHRACRTCGLRECINTQSSGSDLSCPGHPIEVEYKDSYKDPRRSK